MYGLVFLDMMLCFDFALYYGHVDSLVWYEWYGNAIKNIQHKENSFFIEDIYMLLE